MWFSCLAVFEFSFSFFPFLTKKIKKQKTVERSATLDREEKRHREIFSNSSRAVIGWLIYFQLLDEFVSPLRRHYLRIFLLERTRKKFFLFREKSF